MSLQYLWTLFSTYPGQVLNGLALFFAVAGSWLLLATRLREQRAVARLATGSELDEIDEEATLLDEPTQRINRFFYGFGGATLIVALVLSWTSTGF
ncbi:MULTISPECIES: hypothetical protein [unclassified Pseudomonas]|uniref:hypothetical protein n=1 Tax=unclassified Pseudomonas TaxID=196821 RepID=UPI0024477D9D|nr:MULTISPECIES: hypothetical protein [unclassified Pseudomonas]MDG9925493.1 hypothetical protein [Pseudomonas sp. GD04045]MDH0034066.1 hypothetical protein [Pseudomonas sp. GD04019]